MMNREKSHGKGYNMAEKRKLKWKRWLVILLLIGGLTYLYFPTGPVKIIISKETTFIDGPVNPDGTINYVEAINKQFAKGITPENNAVPLLLKAFGVSILHDSTRDEILRRLELTAADIDSDHHFIPWDEREKTGKPAELQAAAANRTKLKISNNDKKVSLEDVQRMLRNGRIHPELQGWLATNAEALRLVEKATTRPLHYMPSVSNSNPPQVIDVSLSGMDCCRDAADAMVTRAMLKLHKGNMDGAWQDILTIHRLARLVQQGPFLIRQLVAIRIENLAAENGITLATSGQLTPQKTKSILQDIVTLQPVGNVVNSVDRGERFMTLDAVMILSRGQDGGDAGSEGNSHKVPNLNWNEMLREVNRWRDRIVKPLRLPRFQGRAEAQKALDTDIDEFLSNVKPKWGPTKMFLLSLGGRLCQKARTRVAT
ncbi:MAG: hypothetical protein K8S55_12175, partial [Phycisphaerae bacterium]|nr:hypothetical protein [Phycisphaerae bacterium]